MRDDTEAYIPLERDCLMCLGRGRVYYPYDQECGACAGTGQTLTEFGRAVLDLVQRYLMACGQPDGLPPAEPWKES